MISPSRVRFTGSLRTAPEDVSSRGSVGGAAPDGKKGVRAGRVMMGSTLK